MIALQTPLIPGEVLKAIVAATPATATEYRVAAAYVTYDGARLLVEELSVAASSWATIPKTVITCFDFGTTDPGALEYLQTHGFEVRIAGLAADAVTLSASGSSYHPKLFAATVGTTVHLVVGSANLTRRALTVNTEAVTTLQSPAVDFAAHWEHLVENSLPLTTALLDEYKKKRPKRRAATVPDEPRVPVPLPAPATLPTFRDEVEAGRINPEEFQAFWVQVGGSSGGSGNQLELPRLGNRFFGYDFDEYGLTYVVEIGEPVLRKSGRIWDDRKLTWHGDNRMERLNLPTKAMSGLTYNNRVVLFHRSGSVFDLTVADPTSVEAQAWKDESAASGLTFRFGPNSNRVCGLF